MTYPLVLRLPYRLLRRPNRPASLLAHSVCLQPGPRLARSRLLWTCELVHDDASPRDLVHDCVLDLARSARPRESHRCERHLCAHGYGSRFVLYHSYFPVRRLFYGSGVIEVRTLMMMILAKAEVL